MIHYSFSTFKPIQEPLLTITVGGKEGLDALHTILHRALNCWAEGPKEFFELSSKIQELYPDVKLLPFNPPGTSKQRAE